MAAPRIVTRSDDLGSFRTANQAIRDACTEGISRNVSVMATTPFIEHAAELLAGRDDICFGLHAVANCEWENPDHRFGPILPPNEVPDLLHDDGTTFVPKVDLLHQRGCPTVQLMAELKAQLARLRELGFDIRYVDTHCGFDWIHPPGQEDKRLSADISRWCATEGLVFNSDLKLKRLPQEEPGIAGLCKAIAAVEDDRTYLMVKHPCYDVEELRSVAHWGGEAGGEGAVRDGQRLDYMHPEVLPAIEARGVDLTRYDAFK